MMQPMLNKTETIETVKKVMTSDVEQQTRHGDGSQLVGSQKPSSSRLHPISRASHHSRCNKRNSGSMTDIPASVSNKRLMF